MTRNERRTAIILDDHPLWLSALESILEEASVTVVGKTTTANEALALLDETKADLFVSDLRLSEEPRVPPASARHSGVTRM